MLISPKTSLAVAIVLAIGLVGGYLLWARQRHDGTEVVADKAAPTPPSPQSGVVASVAGTAVIEGEVQFTGATPTPGKLHREADPYCARTQMSDPTVLVANGKLSNVWVHVVSGAPDVAPPAGAVEISQRDCMYTPRVSTVVVGQKIVVRNDDPVLHNVHTYSGDSTLFNKSMPNEKSAPIEYAPANPGVIRWKCDVHPWMRGYLGVSRNPFQVVTGPDGAFRISQLPPGRYTVEAWHEKLGVKTAEVTAPGRVVFSYDGSEQ